MKPSLHEFEYRFYAVFSRPITEVEKEFIEDIVRYLSSSELRVCDGEVPTFDWCCNNHVVEVNLDTTKTSSDDTSLHFPNFWNRMTDFMDNGSKPYSQAYRGKPKGYQRIPSIGFDSKTLIHIITDCIQVEDSPVLLYDDELDKSVSIYMTTTKYQLPLSSIPSEKEPESDNIITIKVPEGAKEVTVTFKM